MSKINMHPLFAEIFSSFNQAPVLAEQISREALAQAIAEDGDKCDCPHPMLSRGSAICAFCGRYNEEAQAKKEPRHQVGCICADCSGAELTSEND